MKRVVVSGRGVSIRVVEELRGSRGTGLVTWRFCDSCTGCMFSGAPARINMTVCTARLNRALGASARLDLMPAAGKTGETCCVTEAIDATREAEGEGNSGAGFARSRSSSWFILVRRQGSAEKNRDADVCNCLKTPLTNELKALFASREGRLNTRSKRRTRRTLSLKSVSTSSSHNCPCAAVK